MSSRLIPWDLTIRLPALDREEMERLLEKTSAQATGGDPLRRDAIIALVVAATTAIALAFVAFQGWGPQDAGTQGAAALWVGDGAIPHVDYSDVYPGLQAYIHAVFFFFFGISIWTLQLSWLLVTGSAAAFIYLLVRHLGAAQMVAGLTGVGSVVLAAVLYPVAMPTWWNVMLGAASLYLVLRAQMSGRWLPVGVAGLLIGLSALIKTTGLLIAIPSFVWLLSRRPQRRRGTLEVAMALGVALIAMLMSRSVSVSRLILIWGPALGGLVAIYLNRTPRSAVEEVDRAFSPALVYGLAAVAPTAAVVAWYAAMGELGALIDGWVVGPSRRFDFGDIDVPFSLAALIALVVLVLVVRQVSRTFTSGVAAVGVMVFLLAWFVLDRASVSIYVVAFGVWLPALLVAWILFRGRDERASPELALIVAAASVLVIVQIPLWDGAYAAYMLPLLCAAAVGISGRARVVAALGIAVVAGLLLGQSATGYMYGAYASPEKVSFVGLESERGGVRVPEWHAYYNDVIARVRSVATGSAVYASPDAPEIAFLAGVEAANDSLWEALDPSWDPEELVTHARSGAPVVINHDPPFSDPIPAVEVDRVKALLAGGAEFQEFEVRWTP